MFVSLGYKSSDILLVTVELLSVDTPKSGHCIGASIPNEGHRVPNAHCPILPIRLKVY